MCFLSHWSSRLDPNIGEILLCYIVAIQVLINEIWFLFVMHFFFFDWGSSESYLYTLYKLKYVQNCCTLKVIVLCVKGKNCELWLKLYAVRRSGNVKSLLYCYFWCNQKKILHMIINSGLTTISQILTQIVERSWPNFDSSLTASWLWHWPGQDFWQTEDMTWASINQYVLFWIRILVFTTKPPPVGENDFQAFKIHWISSGGNFLWGDYWM